MKLFTSRERQLSLIGLFYAIFTFTTTVLIAVIIGGVSSQRARADTLASQNSSSPRQYVLLSGDEWQFTGDDGQTLLPAIGSSSYNAAAWSNVAVPHVFQSRTDMKTEQGWYRRQFTISAAQTHRHLYLVFEGAAAIADVYVNGTYLGEHRGAFTRFIFDITSAVHVGSDNELAVNVDDRPQSTTDCLPSANVLYTVWGGLYRNVWLMTTNDLQIDPTYYASPGVFITPNLTSPTTATFGIKVLLRNTSDTDIPADVRVTITDPAGNFVEELTAHCDVFSRQGTNVQLSGTVTNPLLWTPETPNLYHVRVDLMDGSTVTDSVTQPLGFHELTWDLKNGLLKVNGQPYTLYGCDLHQEVENRQSAFDASDLAANIDSLKDLGANFVRFSHYPRAQLEYDLCDERGLFCWSENGHSHDDQASPTTDSITTEMVEQNYNHPSIIIWSVGNEGNAAPAEREVSVVKALDQTRPVVVANMACDNADCRTINAYPGWYSGDRWAFKPAGLISETGAGGVISCHTDYFDASHSVNSYEPEEYQQLVAEAEFEDAFEHNDGELGMFTWWILRDFNDNKYKASANPFHNGLNTKGLETYGGFKKDVYYLYRSFLRPNVPTIHITSKLYYLRRGSVSNGIKVYSNAESLTLSLNGKKVSTLGNGSYVQNDTNNSTADSTEVDNVFYWPVVLATGKNIVRASDSHGHSDSAVIYYYGSGAVPELKSLHQAISNLVSSNQANPAYYIDIPVQTQWPVYDDFDSTADNSLDSIPSQISGARWLALRRVTKPGQNTVVSFVAAKPLTVYVICTKAAAQPEWLLDSSFKEVVTEPFQWRGNDMILTDASLYAKHVTTGENVSLTLGERDALVLIKGD